MDALYVKGGFTKFINKMILNHPEQKNFLLRHERRHIAEENVLKEIRHCSLKWGNRFNQKKLDELIEAGASFFCQCAISAKIKQLMTDAEIKRLESKESELQDTQNWLDDMEKEAMSTAVSVSMAGANVSTTHRHSECSLGNSGCDGSAVQPSGGDRSSTGVHSEGIQPGLPEV
jgi:hypothetical protein